MSKLIEIQKNLSDELKKEYAIYLYALKDEVCKENPIHGALLIAAVESTKNEAIRRGREIEKIVRETSKENFIGVAVVSTGDWDLLATKASHRKNIDSFTKFEEEFEEQERKAKNFALNLGKKAEESEMNSYNPETLDYHVYNSYVMLQNYAHMKYHQREAERMKEAFLKRRDNVLQSLNRYPEYGKQWKEKFRNDSEEWGELIKAENLMSKEEEALSAFFTH